MPPLESSSHSKFHFNTYQFDKNQREGLIEINQIVNQWIEQAKVLKKNALDTKYRDLYKSAKSVCLSISFQYLEPLINYSSLPIGGERHLFVIRDSEQHIQSICMIVPDEKKESIEIEFLVSNPENFEKRTFTGAGTAAIYLVTQKFPQKTLFLNADPSSFEFFEKIGFEGQKEYSRLTLNPMELSVDKASKVVSQFREKYF